MTITFSLAQIHAHPPLAFYRSELCIPAFRKGGWIDAGLCPFHHDKHSGNFRINTDTGAFKCFSCEAKGDMIKFVQLKYGLNFKEALEKLSTGSNVNYPITKLCVSRKSDENELVDRSKRMHKALTILQHTVSIEETLAESYLAGRGITVFPPSLRFTASLWNFTSASNHPALIAPIHDASNNITAIHAIFLTPEAQKISGEGIKAKLIFGVAAGGAVQLAPLQDALILTEGIEDGLSLLQSCPAYCVWACCGTSGFANIIVPKTVKSIIIAADNDTAGITAAEKLACRLKSQGFIVSIAFPKYGKDFNDLLQGGA